MTQNDNSFKTYEILGRSLRAHGVDHLFGLMGDANLYMVKSYCDGGYGTYVSCTHEANAVLAAIGYAQVKNCVGVATISHGPALTNAVTALVEAQRGGVPLVILIGDTPPGDNQHLQKIHQREVIAASGAGFVEMRSAETACLDLEEAFRRARYERRPIVFHMRVDLQWHEASFAPPRATAAPQAVAARPEDVEEAIGMLASARRPVILAGRGAAMTGAGPALVKLADRIGAPLATTLKAQGLFEGHPFNLGIYGGLSHPTASQIIAQSDCVLAFGASLSKHTSDNGALLKGKRVVQILPDTIENLRMERPDLRLIGDAALTAEAMIELLDMADIASALATDADLAQALINEQADLARPAKLKPTAAGTVDFIPALRALHQALPKERVLIADLGRFVTTAWSNLPVTQPSDLVYTSHFGAIGCGLGQAIGAALAAGQRHSVLVAGDGGFLLSGLSELNTARRYGLNLTIILCNDGSYGAEHVQFTNRNMDTALSMIDPPDFAAIARAMGFEAHRIDDAESLQKACGTLKGSGLTLIDLRLDADAIQM